MRTIFYVFRIERDSNEAFEWIFSTANVFDKTRTKDDFSANATVWKLVSADTILSHAHSFTNIFR